MTAGFIGVAALLTVVVTIRLRRLRQRMLFPAPVVPLEDLSRRAREQGARELWTTTEDAVVLYGWHLPAGGDRVVLWFEGNSMSVGMRPETFAELRKAGFDVIHFNYRGYPGSGGKPSERGLRADARAAWRVAFRVSSRVFVVGKSLGGA